jgi:hypothetical protein
MNLEGVFPSVMSLEGALALIPPCRPGLATCTRSAATKVPRSPSNGVMKSSLCPPTMFESHLNLIPNRQNIGHPLFFKKYNLHCSVIIPAEIAYHMAKTYDEALFFSA